MATILVANDDGIASPGIAALAEAMVPLGQVVIAAPCAPFSSAGRGFCGGTKRIERRTWPLPGIVAYAVDGSPAYTVRTALDALLERPPDLLVSGINHGENLGTNTTLSGTVGAAIEGAVSGVPAIAFSLEAPVQYHDNPVPGLDFTVAAGIARRLAAAVLRLSLPLGVDLLKVDVPSDATAATPWVITRVSRQKYWRSLVAAGPSGVREIVGYERDIDHATLEPDSDIHAVAVRRVVSVTPMTVDLSAAGIGAGLQALLAEAGA